MQKVQHIVPIWLEMDAHPRHVPWLRSFVQTYFKGGGVDISSRDCMKAQLALVEAFDNVVEHAYPKSRKKPVLVGLYLKGKTLHMEVLDQGRGPPQKKHKLPSVMSDHGRGLFLIYRLSSRVESKRENGWHRLHMRIRLGK
ncbi:MAG: hypothetical protein COV45_08785 [Deltaproteobacteria bacterium CG11_big_fil_rev_8_21_14_0_20_47_16]|nr:MAG: hypothetical protein COV45_08785 [Deltaproteobacteria bacterium CG11_big_fil_rev_8_21_14_0_20_47_16]